MKQAVYIICKFLKYIIITCLAWEEKVLLFYFTFLLSIYSIFLNQVSTMVVFENTYINNPCLDWSEGCLWAGELQLPVLQLHLQGQVQPDQRRLQIVSKLLT